MTMPRGRKPIPRTKEEALQVRREQVRKNVQAYRERKKSRERLEAEEGQSDQGAHEEYSRQDSLKPEGLIVDDVDSGKLPGKLSTSRSSSRSPANNRIEGGRQELKFPIYFSDELGAGNATSVSTSSLQTYSIPEISLSGQRLLSSQRRMLDFLPQAINSAELCRRQFIANTSILFLPQTHYQPEALADLGPHWAQHVPCMCQPNDLLDQTLLPVCLLQVAHLRQDCHLAVASRSYYGQALQALRSNAQAGHVLWKELAISAMLLGTYEIYSGGGDRWAGWETHLQGAWSYLQNFTKFDESLAGLLYFYFLETSCIFDAIRHRKASPLSTSKWWKLSIDRYGGRVYGQLLRLMTSLPALLERFDRLAGIPPATQSHAGMSILLNECSHLDDRLKDWFEETADKVPNFSYDDVEEFDLMPNITPLDPSEVQYSFPNLWIARLHLLYWSSIIQLQGIISELLLSFSKGKGKMTDTNSIISTPEPHSEMLEDLTTQMEMFATNIRRSAAFCLDSRNGLMGKTIIIQPLWMAQRHFTKTDQDQALWCLMILKRIRQDDFGSPISPVPSITVFESTS